MKYKPYVAQDHKNAVDITSKEAELDGWTCKNPNQL